MKKLLNGLYNVVAFITLVITLLGGVWLSLGEDIQNMIPLQLREVLILVFANGSLATFLVATKVVLKRNQEKNDNNNIELTNIIVKLIDKVEDLQKKQDTQNVLFETKLNENNDLRKLELKVKATNPLIQEKLKEEISKVVGK